MKFISTAYINNILESKNKQNVIITTLLGLTLLTTGGYIIYKYCNIMPIYLIITSIIGEIICIYITIYNIYEAIKIQMLKTHLEETRTYNQSLLMLNDNVRCFKHDFNNIIQAIGGYINTNDKKGLKQYYSELVTDCNRVNNLAILNPNTINNPAIYQVLTSKYLKADDLGIKINLLVFLDLNKINMKTYEFTKVLGILLDNAIEASITSSEKIINIEIRNDFKVKRQVLIIENSYSNKNVDTNKIFEKNYTSKINTDYSHGLGLWEVRKILKKNSNLNLFTSKSQDYFKQQLEIYEKN